MDENTPLIIASSTSKTASFAINPTDNNQNYNNNNDDQRIPLFLFLEAQTPFGLLYESFTIFLILLSILTFILSTLFLPQYNTDSPIANSCSKVCDAIWFGNYPDNALSGLGIGATSICEIVIVAIFSVDYLLRFYTADLIDGGKKYGGWWGRVKFVFSFFSLVDLASIVPFYVDSFVLKDVDLASSNFLRMFRFLRMMKVEGRYDLALGMVDDVFYSMRGVLGTALFVGITVWGVLSSFFYLAERRNPSMIYCGAAPSRCFKGQDDIDTSLCIMDDWGVVDCTNAGCPNGDDGKEVCWNLYRSIVDSSFWTLMELFGEFPLVDQHSVGGKVLGTFTAVFAVAVFALPVGIFGSGFEDQIARRREAKRAAMDTLNVGEGDNDVNDTRSHEVGENNFVVGDNSTFRGKLYNFLNRQDTLAANVFEKFIHFLILGTALLFMVDTLGDYYINSHFQSIMNIIEFIIMVIFTVEYIMRLYSASEDPKHIGFTGKMSYVVGLFPLIDLLAVMPYWMEVPFIASGNPSGQVVKFLRLLRMIRFEKYMNILSFFDDAVNESMDILTVTGFSALLLWIFFSSVLYMTERDTADEDMANYYKTVPHAMWITLLNLSGECPLANYSAAGKVTLGFIGLFATAVFGVPIGILGAGFEESVASHAEDSPDQEETTATSDNPDESKTSSIQWRCFQFVNGIGSKAAILFEMLIYLLIGITVIVGIIQTVPGHENTLSWVEWIAVIVFTIEYIIRFVGASVDPEFSDGTDYNSVLGGITKRMKFLVSFYSIIDLMAILPFYLAYMMPGSWVDNNDEYLRMIRLCRLLKLDKYVPSISLVDDVIRLKRRSLTISCIASIVLWVLFSGWMYLSEHEDHSMEIDNLPLYGCIENCTMSVRYNNFFTSFPLVGIHLTGDFPMVEYDGFGRIVCFFMVIAAIGVVSIPSGIIASGFADIVQSKSKSSNNLPKGGTAGDDWFDIRYRELEGQPPPVSVFGPQMDQLQMSIKIYLDGEPDGTTGTVKRTTFSKIGRVFFFALIIANIIAVVLESIPEVDEYIGNQDGNFFDVFEAWSVFFFTVDYILRLLSARKSREALYSPLVYATTFFGIVDLASIAPWYIQVVLSKTGNLSGDEAKVFRIFRIFRVLQLEDFITAFSKLDNVFRASKDVLKATGLMAIIIWVGTSALFFIFEENNPNFRQCDDSIPLVEVDGEPGCYDFDSTAACNEYYPGMCSQSAFTNMPNTMFYVAVFLGGDWGFVDFTWPGKIVCMFLCVAGIALYSVPVGSLFDSFGAVLGLSDDGDDEEEEGESA